MPEKIILSEGGEVSNLEKTRKNKTKKTKTKKHVPFHVANSTFETMNIFSTLMSLLKQIIK